MAAIRAARSWWWAPLKRWQSIPPAIRADTSSRCWRSIRQRWWRSEVALGGLGEGLGVAWVVALPRLRTPSNRNLPPGQPLKAPPSPVLTLRNQVLMTRSGQHGIPEEFLRDGSRWCDGELELGIHPTWSGCPCLRRSSGLVDQQHHAKTRPRKTTERG